MAKILITGGGGFIGSSLAKSLEGDGHEVSVIDRFLSGSRENLAGLRGKIIKGDIRKFDFSLFEDIACIFHEAAITDTTFRDESEMKQVNFEAFKKIARFCADYSVKLVYASSAAVYGKGKVPMKTDQKPDPLNIYAETKLAMEEYIEKERLYDKTEIVALRYFNVYGKDEKFKKRAASQVFQLFRQIKAGKNPRLFKYGEQRRDFVYIKDVVSANKMALFFKGSGIFNVGTGRSWTFNEVARTISEVLGIKKEICYFDNPYEDVYQDNTRADISLSGKKLGYIPQYMLHEGIEDLIKSYEA